MSPWVATTRLSLVATMTLQPVPQNRQGALFHSRPLFSRSVMRLAAMAGTGIPAALAAIAAASSLRTWRRSSFGDVMAVLQQQDWLRAYPCEVRLPHQRDQAPASVAWKTREAVCTCGSSEMVVSVDPSGPVSGASTTMTSLPWA